MEKIHHTSLQGKAILLMSLVIITASGNVVASGNITTTSGDLYLSPMGNNVLPPEDDIASLGNPTNRWANVYAVNIRNVSNIFSGNSKLVFTPGAFGYNDYVIDGSNGGTTVFMTLVAPPFQSVVLRFVPAGDWSRLVQFYVQPGYKNGLVYSAATGDRQIIPELDNNYDLGDSTYRWRSINLYQIKLTPSSSAPTCDNGVMYLTTSNQLKICLSGVWRTVQVT